MSSEWKSPAPRSGGMLTTEDGNVISVQKPSAMTIECTRLSDNVDRLDHKLDMLTGKIDGILGPDRSDPGMMAAEDCPEMSEMTRFIMSRNDHLEALIRRVERVISRVEL